MYSLHDEKGDIREQLIGAIPKDWAYLMKLGDKGNLFIFYAVSWGQVFKANFEFLNISYDFI